VEHAHHAVNDIDEVDIDDALRLATEVFEYVSDEVNLFDRFYAVSAGCFSWSGDGSCKLTEPFDGHNQLRGCVELIDNMRGGAYRCAQEDT